MEKSDIFCGLDLSGPASPEKTVMSVFRDRGDHLDFRASLSPASDEDILEELRQLNRETQVCIGMDAPLSYNDGGGCRPCDWELNSALTEAEENLSVIGVMSPTFQGMAWITLRGITLTRAIMLREELATVSVVEVHPGACLGLRGAPPDALRTYKKGNREGRRRIKDWLTESGLLEIPDDFGDTADELDSVAAALAAWKWERGDPAWLSKANPPHRPFDFAC